MPQCFVVCPFGSESRGEEELRLHRELRGLRTHVFARAERICAGNGLSVAIVDGRETDHGRAQILTATQKSIDAADAILVVLTADKPNVFIELGWAQGMWQSPILLVREGYPLPSDISNDLCILYTPGQAAGADAAGAEQVSVRLAEQIGKRLAIGRTRKPFDHWPMTTLAKGSVNVYNRFSKAISPQEWSHLIQSAEREIIVASTRLSRITGQAFFVTGEDGRPRQMGLDAMLLNKALDGVKVTVILYHEDNLTLGHLKRLQGDVRSVKGDLQASLLRWSTQRLNFETLTRGREGGGAFRVIQLKKRHLPFRVTLTERRVLATLRFYTEVFNSGLCIDALCPEQHVDPENMPVYMQIKEELDFLIEENVEESEAAYQAWAGARRQG